jgi:hypothetical protein
MSLPFCRFCTILPSIFTLSAIASYTSSWKVK